MERPVRLNTKQKRWLKRNKHKLNVQSIADYLDISLVEAREILGFKEKVVSVDIKENYWLAGLLLVAFLILASGLTNSFVSDDLSGILDNPIIKTWRFVINGGILGSLQRLVYFLLANLTGVTPWSFRLVNIILHLITTFLLFKIVRKLHTFSVAIISAALFVVAPVIVEPVIWVSGMPYVLGGTLVMWSLYLHLEDKRALSSYLLEVWSWVMALITIEKFIFLPIVLLVWDWKQKRLKSTWYTIITLLTLSAVRGLALITAVQGRAEVLTKDYYSVGVLSVQNPLAKPIVAIGNYLWLFFWPRALTLYHSEVDLSWRFVVSYGILVVIFCFWIWWLERKKISAWLWAALFVACLVPTLLPFGTSSIVAERYAYLSYSALAVITSLTIAGWSNFDQQRNKYYVLVGMVFVVLGIRTVLRIHDWRDADALWFSAEVYSPHSAQNHNNLGDAYTHQGESNKALAEFTKAIELNPNYADAIHNRADTYLKIGDKNMARKGFQEAIRINPRLWQSYLKLAMIEASDKHWSEAISWTQKTLVVNDTVEIRRILSELKQQEEME